VSNHGRTQGIQSYFICAIVCTERSRWKSQACESWAALQDHDAVHVVVNKVGYSYGVVFTYILYAVII
jgi:hypothetical protein